MKKQKINFAQQFTTINDLLIGDIQRLNNDRKIIESNLKNSLLSKEEVEYNNLIKKYLID